MTFLFNSKEIEAIKYALRMWLILFGAEGNLLEATMRDLLERLENQSGE